MSDHEHPGAPDAELEAFYAAERARPDAPDASRHAALARVLAAVPPVAPTPGPAPLPTAPTLARGTAIAGALASLAVGVVVGAAGHAWWSSAPAPATPPRDTAVEAPVVVAPPEAPPSAVIVPSAPTDEAVDVEPAPIEAAVEPPVPAEASAEAHGSAEEAPAVVPSERGSRDDDDEAGLGSEMALLARAQTALHRGLYASALEALDEHARRYPRGALAEEREALAVQALARAGRTDEARRRADRFAARHPRSLLLPVVRAAVEPTP